MNTSLQVKNLSSGHDLHVFGYTGQSRDASQNLLIAEKKGFLFELFRTFSFRSSRFRSVSSHSVLRAHIGCI